MIVACYALALFSLGFIVHLVIWRIRLPRRPFAAILIILLAVLPPGLFATHWLPWLASLGPWGFWQLSQIALFHIATTLAYVVVYSALEERSPSMTLMIHVSNARGAGRSHDELASLLRAASAVEKRINFMVRDRMIDEIDGYYRLTPRGWAWTNTFSTWRKFSRLKKGG